MSMFERLLFHGRLGRLTSQETEYWRVIFSKILKVGEEFEVHVPENLNLSRTFNRFNEEFEPTGDINRVGKFGVLEVKQDGSVPNGMELVTVGRRFNWKNFYEMNTNIMDKFKEFDFYTSHHTGIHIHLLAGFNGEGEELERPVPEIILANYYQLHRIFAPELFWIASGGCQDYAITRYTLFRQPPFDYSAVSTPMELIRQGMIDKYGKYMMFNLKPANIVGREVTRFHIEARYPDTILSPAYVSALVALEVAMLNKAIDLSQCGIISMKQEEYDLRKTIFHKFANLGTGDRESDSSELTQTDIEKLQIMTAGMIRWFKPEIISINNVAYDILSKIAVNPASIMRISGKNWRQIEEEIYTPELIDSVKRDKLLEIITLQQIVDCRSSVEWKKKASARLDVDLKKAQDLLNYLNRERIVVWDREIGSMMFKQSI